MQEKGKVLCRLSAFAAAVIALLLSFVRVQTQAQEHSVSPAIQFGESYRNDISPSLRDLPTLRKVPPSKHVDIPDRTLDPNAVLRLLAPNAMPPTILNIEGMSSPGVVPPNVGGAAGLTQYVQVAVQSYQVFDKSTGASVFGPVLIQKLWAGFGGPCQTAGTGDPAVLYDKIANRWVISQIAGASVPTDECIAVSTTSDATGTYNRYGFHLGSNFFYYPHLGVWPDGYYMAMNVSNAAGTAFLGPQAFAFDRTKMLAGLPATFVSPGITGGASEPIFLPSDLDGSAPTAGTGNPFVSYPGNGNYNIRLFHADFVTPANTTFNLIGNPSAAGFASLCPGTSGCVPQLGTSQKLDGLGSRLMNRLAYRNFSDHDAIVGNYAVNSSGVAGIHWFELRNVTSASVSVFQESTYQPDTTWRWTGSAAMDRTGNLALGFSASSEIINPQIRYAGRLVSDPPNTLAQGEAELADGTGSQDSPAWGRDSSMTIDPVDDCSFWYTNEYLVAPLGNWRTRIGNFKFAECSAEPTPTPAPTATPFVPHCQLVNPTVETFEAFDTVTPPTLPDGWIATNAQGTAPLWVTSSAGNPSPPADSQLNSAFVDDPDVITDKRLDSRNISLPFAQAIYMTFRHNFNLQNGFDGGVLEINVNGQGFQDILAAGGSFVTGGYNTVISTGSGSPIAGRQAWSGDSGGFITTVVSLQPATLSGSMKLRWRLGTDNGVGGEGWRVDTMVLAYCNKTMGTPSPTPPPPTPSPTHDGTPTPAPVPTVTPFQSSCFAGPATPISEAFDIVTPPELPGGWVATNALGAGPLWVTSGEGNPSPPADSQANSVFVDDPGVISDKRLDWEVFNGTMTSSPGFGYNLFLTFRHNFNLQNGFDGGVLEINRNGSGFRDIIEAGGFFLTGGYNTVISTASGSPIAGRQAWSGNSGGFITTVVYVPAFFDGSWKLRWRLGTDNSVAGEGWRVDTITLTSCIPEGTPTPAPTLSPTPSPSPARALNISTRLRVETGDGVMIGGFIVNGTEPKMVAIRGIGPSLGSSGLTGFLADPTLELRGSDGAVLRQNDNWQDDVTGQEQLIALGLALQSPQESGIVAILQPGAYTAVLAGKDQTAGIGLVEVYDVDPAGASQLANISTRGFVQTGDSVMIGGFILGQGSNTGVVLRGIGPSLSQSGLSNVLADPTMELRDSNGALLIANDNWQDDPDSAARLMAYGLAPTEALESGVFASLQGGLFTAVLAGKNGGVGVGLVEVYDITTPASLTVYSTADSGAGSLRDTIALANSGDIIRFDPSLNGQTMVLTSGELVLDKNITISGPAPGLITVSALGTFPPFRIFHVMPGRTVIIEGLTIRNGSSVTGGGILNDHGTLTVNSCALVHNFGDLGAGIYNETGSATLVINSTVASNFAEVKLVGGGAGGGIYNRGTLEIRNSIITDNSATGNQPHPGTAGGMYNETDGTVTISKSTVSGNMAGSAGGGIANYGTMGLTDSTVSDNRSTLGGTGGGIENGGPLTIVNSTISGNGSNFKGFGNGGGIYNGDAPLIIANSTISGNSCGPLGFGGGIYLAIGTLQIKNTILKAGANGANIFKNSGTFTSQGSNLSSDDGGGFFTGTGDQTDVDPLLGPLQDNGGLTFTHELLAGSPAIDAGDPNFTPPPFYDQRSQPGYDRVYNGRIDIGSFEAQPCCPPSPSPYQQP